MLTVLWVKATLPKGDNTDKATFSFGEYDPPHIYLNIKLATLKALVYK